MLTRQWNDWAATTFVDQWEGFVRNDWGEEIRPAGATNEKRANETSAPATLWLVCAPLHAQNEAVRLPRRARTLDRRACKRMVRAAALSGRRELHSQHRRKPTGDVAGRELRRAHDRSRAGLCPGHGLQLDARLPARPAVEARPSWSDRAHGALPGDCRQAWHPHDVCLLRQLLGPWPKWGKQAGPCPTRTTRCGCSRPASRCCRTPPSSRISSPTCRASSSTSPTIGASLRGTSGTNRTISMAVCGPRCARAAQQAEHSCCRC